MSLLLEILAVCNLRSYTLDHVPGLSVHPDFGVLEGAGPDEEAAQDGAVVRVRDQRVLRVVPEKET